MSTSKDRMAALRARRRDAGEPVEARDIARARKAAWRARRRAEAFAASGAPPQPLRRPRPAERPFWGIDGEGCGTDDSPIATDLGYRQDRPGRQNYMLLCAGNDDELHECFTGRPLSTHTCLSFITSLPPEPILIGFSFGYDVTQILRDIPGGPDSRRRDILAADDDKKEWPRWIAANETGTRQTLTMFRGSKYTWWRGFGIHWRPGHFLRVTRLEPDLNPDGTPNPRRGRAMKGASRTVYESIGFFQCRFAQALRDYDIGTKGELALITRNKAERATFSRITREIRDYCHMECALLSRAMSKLRDTWNKLDIKPQEPSGAGYVAAAMLTKWNILKFDDLASTPRISGVLLHGEAAFYGGRFELQRYGQVPGPLYSFDINSAYPDQMRRLPCLDHATWRYCDGDEISRLYRSDPDAIFVAATHFRHRVRWGNRGMCGLPVRRGRGEHAGVICWPLEGWGTYWSTELHAAELLGARYRFGNGWAYSSDCDCRPFADLPVMYDHRLAIGKKTTEGRFLKLGINAGYGKLVQQVGNGPWRNPIWGSLITAGVRAKINAAIAQAPESVVMIATDGIVSTVPLDLPLSDQLGEWDPGVHPEGLFTVQPGIYWDKTRVTLKTRGVSKGFFADGRRRRRFTHAWAKYAVADAANDRHVGPPTVTLPIHRFVGLAEAEARSVPDLAGCWVDDERAFKFDWSGKRSRAVWEPGPCVRTYPLPGGADFISASHDADAALLAVYEERGLELEDQPDYFQWEAVSD